MNDIDTLVCHHKALTKFVMDSAALTVGILPKVHQFELLELLKEFEEEIDRINNSNLDLHGLIKVVKESN